MLLGLSLAGVVLKGDPIGQYVEFPPVTRYVGHAGFSPFFFCLMSLLFLCTTLLPALVVYAGRKKSCFATRPPHARFPWWGWAGLAVILVGWIVAWNRFQWLKPLQHHTFLPLLLSFPTFEIGLRKLAPFRIGTPKRLAWTGLVISAVGLSLIGVLPDLLFPLVWVSPLLIIVSLQFLTGDKTIFSPLSEGDWRMVIPPALGALICGFFWELWNWNSLAKWEYAIPYVHCFEVFEMPLLGYLGYLPFGLECMVVAERIQGSQIYQLGGRDDGTASR